VLTALSFGAFLFIANTARETLEPLLVLPIGQATLATTTHRIALAIVVADIPLIVIVGVASYVLATISVRPLARAREREERFAADAAHELRTPLATIASVAQAARGGTAQDQALATIAKTALDAATLVGDLLLLMRDVPLSARLHEPVDLGALASHAAAEARTARPDLTIAYARAAGGAFVIGDASALRRIAINLIENAARHARASIEVSVTRIGSEVVLSVADDGPGVGPDDRERVFERFFKAEPSAAGTGLGLAICRKIAADHGGSIALVDRARFVARFPEATR